MPFVIPNPNPESAPTPNQPFYIRQTQNWAIEQERQRHDEAIYWVGEYAFIALMWHTVDFELGLVGRCYTCFNTGDTIQDRVTAVYKQPTKFLCPDCYGTTYEGGYRALLVRPFIFVDADESERQDRRGSVHPMSLTAESTWDFRSYEGDYLFRRDGSRYRVTMQPSRTMLRTGFAHPSQQATTLGYGRMTIGYEEVDTVAYTIAPNGVAVSNILNVSSPEQPADFSSVEVINGPLITGDGIYSTTPSGGTNPGDGTSPGTVTMTGSGWGD
jgi:hypothetical protein